MESKKRIVIVGATSAIAWHCAKIWVHREPVVLWLVGRDADRLSRVEADLKVRRPGLGVRSIRTEFVDPREIQVAVDSIVAEGPIDIVLIAHGSLPVQSNCEADLRACQDALAINGISPVLFAEAFAKRMAVEKRGKIALIGSVAGDRGRRSNYAYGSAKSMVDRYAQGLQHRFAGTGISVILIKPGPTDTPMTAHVKEQGGKLASVEDVARRIVRGIDDKRSVVYAPAIWFWVMLIIRHLPRSIFNRLSI